MSVLTARRRIFLVVQSALVGPVMGQEGTEREKRRISKVAADANAKAM
jgi:hypothetical protein